jgi:hypothetical protein
MYIYMNLHESMCSYEAKNDEKLRTLFKQFLIYPN